MSVGTLAFLAGLLVIPLLFLTLGHRWRRRGPRARAAFWGGLTGYLLASCAALVAGMSPAAEWSPGDTLRGALGFWSLLVAPALGAAVALLLAGNERR